MGGGPHLTCTTAAEMRAALPEGGVLLGLDLGTKTIGTALSDAGWRFASAGKTLPRGKFARDLEALRALVAERGVAGIVLGLPLNMDGSEGPRAQSAGSRIPACASSAVRRIRSLGCDRAYDSARSSASSTPKPTAMRRKTRLAGVPTTPAIVPCSTSKRYWSSHPCAPLACITLSETDSESGGSCECTSRCAR